MWHKKNTHTLGKLLPLDWECSGLTSCLLSRSQEAHVEQCTDLFWLPLCFLITLTHTHTPSTHAHTYLECLSSCALFLLFCADQDAAGTAAVNRDKQKRSWFPRWTNWSTRQTSFFFPQGEWLRFFASGFVLVCVCSHCLRDVCTLD